MVACDRQACTTITRRVADAGSDGLELNSGIGGISDWKDAVEYMLLRSSSVQVCTAVMHYGFRIVEEMNDGLKRWMTKQGFTQLDDFVGRSAPSIVDWKKLNLHHKTIAK